MQARTKDAPLILNGGIFDQYCKGTKAKTNADDHIDYVILGGNVYIPSFSPGAHVNAGAKYPTRHCAVNVLGGRINNLYLTGNFNNAVTPNTDNPHCYIDGGNFKQIGLPLLRKVSMVMFISELIIPSSMSSMVVAHWLINLLQATSMSLLTIVK